MIRFLLLVLFFVSLATAETTVVPNTPAEPSEICLVCSGVITIPETDDEAQILLKFACDRIENSMLAGACRTLASVIHETNTWPVAKWILDRLQGPACALLCPE